MWPGLRRKERDPYAEPESISAVQRPRDAAEATEADARIHSSSPGAASSGVPTINSVGAEQA